MFQFCLYILHKELDFYNVVCREVSTHHFRKAAVLLVMRPVGPLALPGTVDSVLAT